MDRGARQATVHGVTKESDTAEQLSTHTQFSIYIVDPGATWVGTACNHIGINFIQK